MAHSEVPPIHEVHTSRTNCSHIETSSAEKAFTTDLNNSKTLSSILNDQFSALAEHPAVEIEQATLSYRLLSSASSRLAALLHSRNIRPGDHVLILAPRCLEVAVAFIAVLQLGACYVPIDAESWSQDRILDTIHLLDSKTIICLKNIKLSRY